MHRRERGYGGWTLEVVLRDTRDYGCVPACIQLNQLTAHAPRVIHQCCSMCHVDVEPNKKTDRRTKQALGESRDGWLSDPSKVGSLLVQRRETNASQFADSLLRFPIRRPVPSSPLSPQQIRESALEYLRSTGTSGQSYTRQGGCSAGDDRQMAALPRLEKN